MCVLLVLYTSEDDIYFFSMGRRGRDPMVVGFTTTYVFSAYHH